MRDYWRFTPRGLQTLLERAGLEVEHVETWGNRQCVVGNFRRWSAYRPWHSMRNEADLPCTGLGVCTDAPRLRSAACYCGGPSSHVEASELHRFIDPGHAQAQGREALRGDPRRSAARTASAADPDLEHRILRLRHQAGIWLLDDADDASSRGRSWLPDAARRQRAARGCSRRASTPAALRAAILDGGCLLVRGLASRERGRRACRGDRRRASRPGSRAATTAPASGLYEEFEPDPRFEAPDRPWIAETGGVLVGDSPKLMFDTLDLFERTGLRQLLADYLGERPAVSLQKSTLRKAESRAPPAPGTRTAASWARFGR